MIDPSPLADGWIYTGGITTTPSRFGCLIVLSMPCSQQIAIGFQQRFRGASIQPDIHLIGVHAHTTFQHDIHRICQEIFTFQLEIVFHLLIDG